ncbi:hypothetical protein KY385_01390 [Candidatus Parcubacteria bacterium]|nr:hypothetical protein [Candidatus Parcubacteria bacterium]
MPDTAEASRQTYESLLEVTARGSNDLPVSYYFIGDGFAVGVSNPVTLPQLEMRIIDEKHTQEGGRVLIANVGKQLTRLTATHSSEPELHVPTSTFKNIVQAVNKAEPAPPNTADWDIGERTALETPVVEGFNPDANRELLASFFITLGHVARTQEL